MFDAEYGDIARTLGKFEASCRQMVSRAAHRVQQERPRFAPDPDAALLQFALAAVAQDHAAVLNLLAPEVTAISDGGGNPRAALRPLNGAQEVAQVILAVVAERGLDGPMPGLISVNGSPALAILEGGADDVIYSLTLDSSGRIDWIYIMRNPDKMPGAGCRLIWRQP